MSASERASIKFYLQRVGCTLDQMAKDWNEFEQQHFVVQPVGEPSMSKSLDQLATELSVFVAYLSCVDFETKPEIEIIFLNFQRALPSEIISSMADYTEYYSMSGIKVVKSDIMRCCKLKMHSLEVLLV